VYYRVESLVIKSESSSPSFSYTSYFADGHLCSNIEENEDSVIAATHTTSQAASLESISDDIALQLAT